MKSIIAVAEYIFKQNFRNKILNVLIIFAIFGIGFSLIISELAQEVEIKMTKDFGLFTISIFSFLTLILSMTIQLFEETELKTLSLVLVKPIKRSEFIIGKFLGIILTLLMNITLMFILLMLIIKIRGGDPWNLQMFLSVLGTFLSLSILSSVALLLSMLTTSVPGCIIFLFFVYVLGHLTVHLKNLAAQITNPLIVKLIDIIYFVVPNLELFNLKDKIYSNQILFSPEYLFFILIYSITYIIISLMLTIAIFNKKEF